VVGTDDEGQDATHPINEGWETPVGVAETVLTRSAI